MTTAPVPKSQLNAALPDLPKQQIASRFGQAAPTYHSQAKLQQISATKLVDLLLQHRDSLPAGPVLEIGCGTGFITQLLLNQLAPRPLQITDLSAEMLQFCRANLVLPENARVTFSQLDAEHLCDSSQNYAVMVGGFVLQWFKHPEQSILALVDQLAPQGLLALSFPTAECFPEWRHICQQINLPYTANPLPDTVGLADALATYPQLQFLDQITVESVTTYPGAASFFRDLKTIGASTAAQQLSPSQMRRLIRAWDDQTGGQTQVQYQVAFWVIRRAEA
jgi:malonyl-CoA O-methyltransferase